MKQHVKGDVVWAVPNSNVAARLEAYLIAGLSSAETAAEYEWARKELSKRGYPDDVLDTVPRPRE